MKTKTIIVKEIADLGMVTLTVTGQSQTGTNVFGTYSFESGEPLSDAAKFVAFLNNNVESNFRTFRATPMQNEELHIFVENMITKIPYCVIYSDGKLQATYSISANALMDFVANGYISEM